MDGDDFHRQINNPVDLYDAADLPTPPSPVHEHGGAEMEHDAPGVVSENLNTPGTETPPADDPRATEDALAIAKEVLERIVAGSWGDDDLFSGSNDESETGTNENKDTERKQEENASDIKEKEVENTSAEGKESNESVIDNDWKEEGEGHGMEETSTTDSDGKGNDTREEYNRIVDEGKEEDKEVERILAGGSEDYEERKAFSEQELNADNEKEVQNISSEDECKSEVSKELEAECTVEGDSTISVGGKSDSNKTYDQAKVSDNSFVMELKSDHENKAEEGTRDSKCSLIEVNKTDDIKHEGTISNMEESESRPLGGNLVDEETPENDCIISENNKIDEKLEQGDNKLSYSGTDAGKEEDDAVVVKENISGDGNETYYSTLLQESNNDKAKGVDEFTIVDLCDSDDEQEGSNATLIEERNEEYTNKQEHITPEVKGIPDDVKDCVSKIDPPIKQADDNFTEESKEFPEKSGTNATETQLLKKDENFTHKNEDKMDESKEAEYGNNAAVDNTVAEGSKTSKAEEQGDNVSLEGGIKCSNVVEDISDGDGAGNGGKQECVDTLKEDGKLDYTNEKNDCVLQDECKTYDEKGEGSDKKDERKLEEKYKSQVEKQWEDEGIMVEESESDEEKSIADDNTHLEESKSGYGKSESNFEDNSKIDNKNEETKNTFTEKSELCGEIIEIYDSRSEDGEEDTYTEENETGENITPRQESTDVSEIDIHTEESKPYDENRFGEAMNIGSERPDAIAHIEKNKTPTNEIIDGASTIASKCSSNDEEEISNPEEKYKPSSTIADRNIATLQEPEGSNGEGDDDCIIVEDNKTDGKMYYKDGIDSQDKTTSIETFHGDNTHQEERNPVDKNETMPTQSTSDDDCFIVEHSSINADCSGPRKPSDSEGEDDDDNELLSESESDDEHGNENPPEPETDDEHGNENPPEPEGEGNDDNEMPPEPESEGANDNEMPPEPESEGANDNEMPPKPDSGGSNDNEMPPEPECGSDNGHEIPPEPKSEGANDHEIPPEPKSEGANDNEMPPEPESEDDNDHEIPPEPKSEGANDNEIPPESKSEGANDNEIPPEPESESANDNEIPPEPESEGANDNEIPPEPESESANDNKIPPEPESECANDNEIPPEPESECANDNETPPESESECANENEIPSEPVSGGANDFGIPPEPESEGDYENGIPPEPESEGEKDKEIPPEPKSEGGNDNETPPKPSNMRVMENEEGDCYIVEDMKTDDTMHTGGSNTQEENKPNNAEGSDDVLPVTGGEAGSNRRADGPSFIEDSRTEYKATDIVISLLDETESDNGKVEDDNILVGETRPDKKIEEKLSAANETGEMEDECNSSPKEKNTAKSEKEMDSMEISDKNKFLSVNEVSDGVPTGDNETNDILRGGVNTDKDVSKPDGGEEEGDIKTTEINKSKQKVSLAQDNETDSQIAVSSEHAEESTSGVRRQRDAKAHEKNAYGRQIDIEGTDENATVKGNKCEGSKPEEESSSSDDDIFEEAIEMPLFDREFNPSQFNAGKNSFEDETKGDIHRNLSGKGPCREDGSNEDNALNKGTNNASDTSRSECSLDRSEEEMSYQTVSDDGDSLCGISETQDLDSKASEDIIDQTLENIINEIEREDIAAKSRSRVFRSFKEKGLKEKLREEAYIKNKQFIEQTLEKGIEIKTFGGLPYIIKDVSNALEIHLSDDECKTKACERTNETANTRIMNSESKSEDSENEMVERKVEDKSKCLEEKKITEERNELSSLPKMETNVKNMEEYGESQQSDEKVMHGEQSSEKSVVNEAQSEKNEEAFNELKSEKNIASGNKSRESTDNNRSSLNKRKRKTPTGKNLLKKKASSESQSSRKKKRRTKNRSLEKESEDIRRAKEESIITYKREKRSRELESVEHMGDEKDIKKSRISRRRTSSIENMGSKHPELHDENAQESSDTKSNTDNKQIKDEKQQIKEEIVVDPENRAQNESDNSKDNFNKGGGLLMICERSEALGSLLSKERGQECQDETESDVAMSVPPNAVIPGESREVESVYEGISVASGLGPAAINVAEISPTHDLKRQTIKKRKSLEDSAEMGSNWAKRRSGRIPRYPDRLEYHKKGNC